MFWSANVANASIQSVPKEAFGPKSQSVEEFVREYFASEPVLIEIARCESQFRQYDEKGAVLRGEVVSDDIGIMQINDHFHGDTAKKMGFNIRTIEGNLAYAKMLYDKQGIAPWSASKKCWSVVHKELAQK